MRARLLWMFMGLTLVCAIGSAAAQAGKPPSGPKPEGPVQGYQGGYDPSDQSKAPAARSAAPTDTANPDEGGGTREVTGRVAWMDNATMTLTLEGGRVFTLPPTLKLDGADLKPGTPVRVSVQRRDGAERVTAVQIAEGTSR